MSSLNEDEAYYFNGNRKRSLVGTESGDGSPKKLRTKLEVKGDVNVVFVDDVAVEGFSEILNEESFVVECQSSPKNETLTTQEPHFPGDIDGCPVYTFSEKGISLRRILEICISKKVDVRYVCERAPMDVPQTSSFILDLQHIGQKDIAAGDNGMFGRHSSPSRFLSAKIARDGTVEDFKALKSSIEATLPAKPGYDHYRVKRQYSWHRYIKGFSRIVTRIEKNGVPFRFGILQFKVPFDTGEVTVDTLENANSQRANKSKSVQASASREEEEEPHSAPVITSSETTPCQAQEVEPSLPTNSTPSSGKAEIYNILKSVNSDRPKPKLSSVPDSSRLLMLLEGDNFLRDVSFSSFVSDNCKQINVRTFAMGEVQEHWLKTFCSGSNPKSRASIGMSHKLGAHYVITMTCPLPMFEYHDDSQRHPVVLLAFMTSQTNDKSDYEYFSNNLRRTGVSSMTYGTNGESSVDSGLEGTFPHDDPKTKNILLCDFDRATATVSSELEELSINKYDSEIILKQIFGSESEEESVNCLVDQESDASFDALLSIFHGSWPVEFWSWFHSTERRVRSFAETIKKCMLKPVRIKAGLGNPPARYNGMFAIETLDKTIHELSKSQIGPDDLVKFHELVKSKVVEAQVVEFVKAMYNMGDLRLSQEYRHLCVALLSFGD